MARCWRHGRGLPRARSASRARRGDQADSRNASRRMRAVCIASSRKRARPASSITRTSWPSTTSASHAGAPYIVSELLEGESLRSRLRAGALPWRKAVDYARQIAEGLAAAHDKTHRPSRREARQPVRHERRTHQDPRLRHRQADAPERRRRPDTPAFADRDQCWHRGRHGGLHVAGAGPRRSRGRPVGPLQRRGDSLRDARRPSCVCP